MTRRTRHKALIEPLREALYRGPGVRAALARLIAPEAELRLCHPFATVRGPEALWEVLYAPLLQAMPDMERRDFIVMAGAASHTDRRGDWIGLGGNIIGTLRAPWLGIPATGRPVFLRYHEYMRIEGDQVVEMEMIWDIPQVMVQAGVWPMAPQRGVEWLCPGPADGSGLNARPDDTDRARAAVQLVWDMLHDLQQGNAADPGRGLGGYWHDNALWYGSTGIGSARGHAGIRDTVLRQFREGLSDNQRRLHEGVFFGEHDLVAFTGWPSGEATHSGDGFLGLAPTGRRFSRRSLDFWRVEDGTIRENWVMVDMLDLYRQLGVDVFERLQALPDRAA